MASWIKDLGLGVKGLASDTLGAAMGMSIKEFVTGLGKKGKEVAVGKIESLLKDNPRADLLYILLALDPDDASKLWMRHLGAIANGTENAFAQTLGQAIPRDKDGKVDTERAKSVFTQIAQMGENRFCQILEELNHDPVAQHVRHWLKHGKSFAEAICEGVAFGAGKIAKNYRKLDQQAETLALLINDRAENPGWYGRLANRIFR